MTEIHTDAQFQAAISRKGLAVICFHSPRSTYSRRVVQTLREAGKDLALAEFSLVDADKDALLPLLREKRVVALPTVLIFQEGVQIKCLVGERSQKSLLNLLNSCLA